VTGYEIYFVIASIGCLMLALARLDFYQLRLGQILRLALIWLTIFVGLYALVEWFLIVKGTASALI
jgi:hypothetical protein